METKEFKIVINASKEKVWNILWDDATYREWTSDFCEGSRAETTWEKGSKALFLDPSNSGMVSVIAENKPFEYMSIQHIGTIKNGVEDMESTPWKDAYENYNLQTVNGQTELTVDMTINGIPQEFLDYLFDTWPKALSKVKQIAERD